MLNINKLISIVKQILNSEKILYYSDSNIINHEFPFEAKNGFHNDSRFEDENIPFKEEYPLVRVGIYFEDYKKYSGGLKIKEKDLEIKRLIKEAEDARSRLDHVKNSQELVGEAAEVLLLERLQNNFTFDQFQEIKKGQQGADIFQTVCNRSDEIIGSILYECKKTKR